jgi:hypothetical protein
LEKQVSLLTGFAPKSIKSLSSACIPSPIPLSKIISIPFEIRFLIVSGCKTDLLSEASYDFIAEMINLNSFFIFLILL